MSRIAALSLCLTLSRIVPSLYGQELTMQPGLKEQLSTAPLVEPEELGAVVNTVTAYPSYPLVPNPDGKTYDVLLWYYRGYSGPTWLYAVDLGTGRVHRQEFPLKRQIHIAGQTLGLDGKYYIAVPYGHYGTKHEAAKLGLKTGMELVVYDPATNELTNRGVIAPDLLGERRPLGLGPDGKLYGAGTYGASKKVGVYSYDPTTGKVREYGPVGPPHKGGTWAGSRILADETHIYTLSGFTPYYLVAVNIETGKDTVLLETEPGGQMRLRPGMEVDVEETKGADSRRYWLYNGAAILRTDNRPPWPARNWPEPPKPPRPELHIGDRYPDADGRARLWYRPAVDADAGRAGAKAEQREWKAIELTDIPTYPQVINLLVELPDGRIFCKAQLHLGGSIFNPKTGRIDAFGDGPTETYDMLVHEGKVYWTGYSSGRTCVYDPTRPWTLRKGVPPGQKPANIRDKGTNPHQLGLFHEYKVSQMLSAAVGADNKLYLCGWGVRAYKGGAFCWVDLETDESGGMWEPFIAYRTYWLAPALDRRFIVMSSAATSDALNNWQEAPQGKLFVYDTESSTFVREIEPVLRSAKTGPILEVEPGLMLGVADDPDVRGGGILYKVDIRNGEVLFRKKIPYTVPIPTSHSSALCGYKLGPGGVIWTFLGRGAWAKDTPDTLVRIDRQGHIEPVCRVKKLGNFIFLGNDLYLTGTDQLRRIRGIGARGGGQ